MTEMISRWSEWAGRSFGSTLQDIKGDGESAFLQTLSGLVQFPVLRALSVGVSRGRAISSRMFTMRSRRGFSSLLLLVRCSLCLASQVLW